jgi:clan AA aspartic protease
MRRMGLTYVTVEMSRDADSKGRYRADFLVDTGATDSMAPAGALRRAGIKPVGSTAYELADGSIRQFSFGLVVIRFMGETTAGRVIFGEDTAEPLLGVTALESVGILVDPANKTLRRLPAIPLKSVVARRPVG